MGECLSNDLAKIEKTTPKVFYKTDWKKKVTLQQEPNLNSYVIMLNWDCLQIDNKKAIQL